MNFCFYSSIQINDAKFHETSEIRVEVEKQTDRQCYLYMWSHQAKAITWVYLEILIFFLFFHCLHIEQCVPAENDFGISNFPLCCPIYNF